MDEKVPMIHLLAGVEMLHDADGWAMRCGDVLRRAKDRQQEAFIEALAEGHRSLASLTKAVRAHGVCERDDEASVALAGFILDFEGFIKG